MILSLRSPLLPALAALLAASCAAPFTIVYCEDGGPQPIHCDCARAPREVAGGRVGRVEVREYERDGTLHRHYNQARDLQFVLIDRWLVLSVHSRRDSPTSLQAWLDCDSDTIVGRIVPRGIDRDDSGIHEHEYLALFPGPLEHDETRRCTMHVVLADGGWILSQSIERVHVVARARLAEPFAGLTWGVTLTEDPAPLPAESEAGLAPPPEPAEPRLCR